MSPLTLSIRLLAVCVSALLFFGPTALAADHSVTLTWNPNSEPDLAGYNVFHGTASGNYGGPNSEQSTVHEVNNLKPNETHYFAVTAYDHSGNESALSNEISTFIEGAKYALGVEISGGGRVTSAPLGIDCVGTCSAEFDEGDIVTLTAVPNADMVFAGWGGACTGLGTCTLSMTGAANVTATFVPVADPPDPGTITKINFQPPGAPVPDGYVKADGALYSASLGYGWDRPLDSRDRNLASNQALDTFVFLGSGDAVWNYAIANGSYLVSVASGDAGWEQGAHQVVVEGQTVIDNALTGINEFATATDVLVTVTDGMLTVVLAKTSGKNAMLNYLIIQAVEAEPPVMTRVNFQPPNAVLPDGYLKDFGALYTMEQGYGWSQRVQSRDRNLMANQVLDTFVMVKDSSATWNYDLENGDYLVSVTSGDASFSQGGHHVTVEGQTILGNVYTAAHDFMTVTDFPVTVADGTLTIVLSHTEGKHAMLNQVSFRRADSVLPPQPKPVPTVEKHINFQPPKADVPEGYVRDSGALYTMERGYGWSQLVQSRDRDVHTDQRNDTFVFLAEGAATWTYDVANGDYLVSLTSGDASFGQGAHHIQVEGQTLIDNVWTLPYEFVTVTDVPVTVTDGTLTVVLTKMEGKHVMLNSLSFRPVE